MMFCARISSIAAFVHDLCLSKFITSKKGTSDGLFSHLLHTRRHVKGIAVKPYTLLPIWYVFTQRKATTNLVIIPIPGHGNATTFSDS